MMKSRLPRTRYDSPGGHVLGECTNCRVNALFGLGIDLTPTAACAGQCFGRDDYTSCVATCVAGGGGTTTAPAASTTPWLIGGAAVLVLAGAALVWQHNR